MARGRRGAAAPACPNYGRDQPARHRAPRPRHRHQLVEARGEVASDGLLGRLVEPREVRQQQARVMAAARADPLAPEPHRLLVAVERAGAQRLLGRPACQHQRRLPPGIESAIPPPRDIGRLVREPHPRRRRPHIPRLGEVMQKRRLARRCPGIVVELILPETGRGTIRRMVEGTRVLKQGRAVLSAPTTPACGSGPPPRPGEDILTRQADIPIGRYPPPPERRGIARPRAIRF